MTDEPPSYEQGDRVALMRTAPITGDIQIIEAIVLGMVDRTRSSCASPAAPSSRCPSAR